MKLAHLLIAFSCIASLAIFQACDDEEPFKFTTTDFSTTIAENPESGDVVGTIEATVNKGELTFELNDSELFPDAFSINSTTGEISINEASYFDMEARTSVTGSVTVTAGSTEEVVNITVNLTNVNELVMSNFIYNAAENLPAGTLVSTLKVDNWAELSTPVTYEIVTQTPAGAFTLEPTGLLKIADASKMNFELYPSIVATIRAVGEKGFDVVQSTYTLNLSDVAETVQERLDDGETPYQIYTSNNSLLNQIYGKTYEGGIIATFNTTGTDKGNCLIMYIDMTQSLAASAAATFANNLETGGKSDWRLPTETEANSMCATLGVVNNLFPFAYFWTSTSCGGICVRAYYFSNSSCGNGGEPASNTHHLVAVRLFDDPNN